MLLTFDKDFGDLAFHANLPAECGVLLFRISVPSPAVAARRAVEVLGQRTDWVGNFAVVGDDRIRLRPLPAAKKPGSAGQP